MANNPNPQEFNRDVAVEKPEDLTNYSNQYKPKSYDAEVFPDQVASVDVSNTRSAAGVGAPEQHVTHVTPEIRDREKEILLRTAGEVGLIGLKAGDVLYRQHAEQNVQEALDEANSAFTIDTESLVLQSNEMPEDVMKADDKLYMMTAAFKSGKMRESAYLVKVAEVANRLKSKYGITPGYAKVVDNMITRHLGFDPENRLREHVIQQAETAARKAAAETPLDQKVFERNVLYNQGDLPPEVMANPEAFNNPEGRAKVNLYVAQQQQQKAEYDRTLKAFQVGEATEKEAGRLTLMSMTNQFTRANNAAGVNMKAIVGKLQGLQEKAGNKSTPLSQEEATQLAELSGQVERMGYAVVERHLQNLGPNASAETRNKVVEYGKTLVDISLRGMKSVESNAVAEFTNSYMNDNAQWLMNSNPRYGVSGLAAVTEAQERIDTNPNNVFLSNRQVSQEDIKSISDSIFDAYTGKAPLASTLAGQNGVVTGSTLDQFIRDVSDESADPSLKVRAVDALFDENITEILRQVPTSTEIGQGSAPPAAKLYYKLASPEFAKGVLATGNQDTINKYEKFLLDHYMDYNQANIHRVQGVNTKRPRMELELNEQTLEFSIKKLSGDAVKPMTTTGGLEPAYESLWGERNARHAVSEFNRQTLALTQAYKTLGHTDPRDEIKALWVGMGFNLDAPYEKSPALGLKDLLQMGISKVFGEKPEDNKKEE